MHVACLRLTAGRHPTDARAAEPIGELIMRSPESAAMWDRGEVRDRVVGTMLLRHPTVGELDVDHQVWLQPDSPDPHLEIYTARGESDRDALRLLGSQHAGCPAPARPQAAVPSRTPS